MTKYVGKDGRTYDDYHSYTLGNLAWDKMQAQQQEQNKLLKEQNKLLEQQEKQKKEIELEKIKQQKEIELEKMRQQEELERQRQITQREKMYHEDKMRILKLFDDIGMSKETYYNFKKRLFKNSLEDLRTINNAEQELKELKRKLNVESLENCLNRIRVNDFKKFEYFFPKLSCSIEQEDLPIEKRNEIITWVNNIEEYKEELKKIGIYDITKKLIKWTNDIEKYGSELKNRGYYDSIIKLNKSQNENMNRNEQSNSKGLIFLIISIIVFILSIISGLGVMWVLFIIVLIPTISYMIKPNSINDITNNETSPLEYCILDIYTHIYYYQQNNINPEQIIKDKIEEKEVELEKFKNKIQETKKRYQETLTKSILPKWNDFIEFRKNHYNSKIEKLLIDMNLNNDIKKLKLEYPKINNSNKISDGTIEDYITYFDNF